jgi:hypothetical protein
MTHGAQLLWGVISVLAGSGDGGDPATSPGSEEPLLVIVERGHGATTNPEQVRHAISEELHRPVVGPADAAGKNASQMLVVTIAADSVAMQMRSAGDLAARRRIEPLVSGESSLRVVAWLAGNLARDQASELMDAMPGTSSPIPETPPPAVATQPPPQAELATAPASSATKPAASIEAAPDAEAGWRVGLSLGMQGAFWAGNLQTVGSQRLEVISPPRAGKWSLTASLDVISVPQSRVYFLWGGMSHRSTLVPRWLAADVGWGVGMALERYDLPVGTATAGTFDTTTYGPYVAVNLTGTLALVRLRFGEVVAGMMVADVLEDWQVPRFGASGGLRIALP